MVVGGAMAMKTSIIHMLAQGMSSVEDKALFPSVKITTLNPKSVTYGQLYANGGFSLDLSRPVLDRAMFHVDNAYFIPNLKVTGRVCRTNLPSNTAFRGFGGPQVLS